CQWSPPLAIDWFDNSVYFGCQVILRTRDRGQTWEQISEDLSTRDPSRIRFSGGVVGDNLGQFYGAVVSAIAPSRTQQGVIWAGTNDGKVWITRDAGRNWTDLTAKVQMPPWGLVRRIDASHHDPATAYMAVDYHLVDNRDPYFFKTTDYGQTWTRLDASLPKGHPLDYALSIAENPHRRGMLFAGTGHGFFYSRDDGRNWTQVKDKLPAAPVNWIEVPKNAAEVAVATYGRGLWILRDIWTLEQGDQVDAQAELQLYKPRPATRTANGGTANFIFALTGAPSSPVTVEVLGSDNNVVSRSQVQGRVGMNRATWNLLHAAPARPVLRSVPPDNPQIWEANRWQNRERPVTHWGLGAATWQPRAAPGKYTVRMTYNGKQYTQPFEVWRDVTMPSADADLVASTDLQRNVVTALNEVVDKINRIEVMRQQVEDLRKQNASNKQLDQALAGIYKRMYDTELHFLSRTEMHSDDKWYVEKYKLYLNLVWLLAELGGGGGDVMGGVSYRPTNAAVSVFQDRLRDLEAGRTDFNRLMQEVEAFNRSHSGRLPAISDRVV
ncbi:MAG: WD40/YVTN/BNR-like repeat-containing protein, partial [Longimicrobiales bacterium]